MSTLILFNFRNLRATTLGITLMASTACETPEQVTVGNTDIRVVAATPTPRPTPDGNAVCDPFGNSGASTAQSGLKGRLFYLAPNLPRYETVAEYQANGEELSNDLFFSQLNVPTRPFDQGFMTQNGTVLKTPQGDTLYEWFSVHFESQISLRASDAEGLYQFALLSDDGAVMEIKPTASGGFETLVNNDGLHPTRLGCASNTVRLNRGDHLPIRVNYYQGPRYHIALILLWRKLSDDCGAGDLAEPLCGAQGNSYFFDSTQSPPRASARWMELLGRGWQVVHPENYSIPSNSTPNPCASPTPEPTPEPTPTPTPPPCSNPIGCGGLIV